MTTSQWKGSIGRCARPVARNHARGAGSTPKGMRHVKEGRIHAITFQPAQADGALAMKIAVDWFSGLDIQPINYLPKHIITGRTSMTSSPRSRYSPRIHRRPHARGRSRHEEQVERFFEDAYVNFLSAEMVTPEVFRGFSIEVLSALIHVLKMNDLDEQSPLSDYESLYKNLFNQKTPRRALEWMMSTAKEAIRALSRAREAESPSSASSVTSRAITRSHSR